jgi:outer membrane immunogenic protein
MFKKLLFAATAAVGLAFGQGASAADLPFKARPMPPPVPVFSWTGFYIGAHGGAGWGTVETSADVGASLAAAGIPGVGFNLPLTSHSINGFLAGGTIGYNYQIGSNWLIGLEGDFSWADIKGTSDCLIIFACTTKVNWMADATVRLGFVALDRLLVYAKGGVAFADTDYTFGNSVTIPTTPPTTASLTASVSDTRVGALFGFGAEYAFMPNWSAKLEYNFMDFGTERYNVPTTVRAAVGGVPVAGTPFTFTTVADVNQVIHTMKIGVNYKFW